MKNKFIFPLRWTVLLGLLWMLNIPTASSQLIWLESQFISDNKIALVDLTKQSAEVHHSNESNLINYNPASSFNQNEIDFELDLEHLNQCNIFTIYKSSSHAQESLIWSIKDASKERLSLTDQRIVDFGQGKFMNFLDNTPAKPQINTYQHYKKDFIGNALTLGGQFSNSKIPVGLFEGNLAEIIVFNQVLAPSSKSRLESALAIKYSVSLSEGHNYVDASGKVIWDAEENASFSNRIAGLGRSDVLHLNQKQSKSELGNGFIAFGIIDISTANYQNNSKQADQSYLMWGDDNGLLEFEKRSGKPAKLLRNWKMIAERYNGERNFKIQFKHNGMFNELDKNEYLWLAISKNQNYSIEDTKYYRFDKEESNPIHETIFDLSDISDKYFSFIKAPKVWADIEIIHSDCAEGKPGSISFIPIGGTAPYHVDIKSNKDNYKESITLNDKSKIEIEGLETGQYTFIITDKDEVKWQTIIYINSSEIPVPKLNSKYFLDNTSMELDAGVEIPQNASLTWISPDGSTRNEESIYLEQGGLHHLQIEMNGCISLFPFDVIAIENNISNLSVNPNPTINGYFELNASLKEAIPYSIIINSLDGRLISNFSFQSAKYIHQTLTVPTSGVFMITLVSGSSRMTKKLVAHLGH